MGKAGSGNKNVYWNNKSHSRTPLVAKRQREKVRNAW